MIDGNHLHLDDIKQGLEDAVVAMETRLCDVVLLGWELSRPPQIHELSEDLRDVRPRHNLRRVYLRVKNAVHILRVR